LATLKEISTELGLSVTTVSRALNGFPEVNKATREKVQEAASKLGYRPNRVAQRLVTGRSGMVGMIVKIKPDMSADQTFFEILTGLTAALAERETDLVLAVDQDEDPVLSYKKLLERDILDGFILNAPVLDDPRVNYLTEQGIPFVLHGQDRPDPGYPTYGIDNAEVSQTAVKLLSQLGFVCASTLIASGVMKAVRDRGLRVPDDVSIIAHDDALPLTRAISFDPALTVTRAPLRDACAPLANMLIEHLNGTPAKDLNVVLKAELIVRGSTGPAPKGE